MEPLVITPSSSTCQDRSWLAFWWFNRGLKLKNMASIGKPVCGAVCSMQTESLALRQQRLSHNLLHWQGLGYALPMFLHLLQIIYRYSSKLIWNISWSVSSSFGLYCFCHDGMCMRRTVPGTIFVLLEWDLDITCWELSNRASVRKLHPVIGG